MVQPGMAAGLARLEVQEKVERERHPGSRLVMPLDEVLCQLLAECTNYQAAKVLGMSEVSRLQQARERLKVPMPWCSRPKEFVLAAGRVAERRWAMWQEQVPPPLSKEELLALIEAEMGKVRPAPEEVQPHPGAAAQTPPTQKKAPITPGRILVTVEQYHKTHGRWPTLAEIAVELDRQVPYIGERVRLLLQQGKLDKDGLQLVYVRPNGDPEAAMKKEIWPREQLEAHLLSLGVDPRPGVKRSIKPIHTQPADPATPEEVHPPMDARVAAPDELLPEDLPVQDLNDPAPPAPGTRGKYNWPSDRSLVDEAEAIAARGESISRVLCAKLGVKDGALWMRIGDARERLGLPRKMGIKRGGTRNDVPPAKIAAPPAKLAEYLCDRCKDTGMVGGKNSGIICECSSGDQIRVDLYGGGRADPALTMPSSIAEPSSGPREGGSSVEQTPASEAATDAQEGMPAQAAELKALVENLESSVAYRDRVIVENERLYNDLLAKWAKDQVTIQQLTATIEQAMTEASTPVLLLQYKGQVREVPLPEGQALLSVGDHYAEQVNVGGRRRVAIWECTGTGIVGGRIVCICKLIKAAPQPQAREAA